MAFGGLHGAAGAAALVDRVRPDVVLAMSPPLTLGPAAWAVARARRAPFVFNVQDVFPDVAVELGVLTNPRAIAAAAALERFVYQRADAVTVLSEDLARQRAGQARRRRGRRPDRKVRVIPNFVDTEFIRPSPAANAYRREHGLEGRVVVMYAGQRGLLPVLRPRRRRRPGRWLEERPDVMFVINGAGSARADLERASPGCRTSASSTCNPASACRRCSRPADLHLIPLRRGLARSSVPSKLYSILAAGRPVLAAVDEGTEVARTVVRAGAGRAVPPDDPTAFVAALRALLAAPGELAAMGRAGRRFVEGWASPAAVGRAYSELFAELVARDDPGDRIAAGRPIPWSRHALIELHPAGGEGRPLLGQAGLLSGRASRSLAFPIDVAVIIVVGIGVIVAGRRCPGRRVDDPPPDRRPLALRLRHLHLRQLHLQP